MYLSPQAAWRPYLARLSNLVAVTFSLQVLCTESIAIETARVEFDTSKPDEIAILIGDERVALFVYNDNKIARPYFAHVRVPHAPQVTRNHPPIAGEDETDHGTFHPGLWMSFGDISGSDYWRLAARTASDCDLQSLRGGEGKGTFAVHNQYFDQQDTSKIVCEEDCRFAILVKPDGFLLLWDSTFFSSQNFYFGDQEEMGLGCRLETSIRADLKSKHGIAGGNGSILDSKGRKNEDQIWGNSADWCDYSGTVNAQHIGITLFGHPRNLRPSWFHARDYGFMAANLFGRNAFSKGEQSRVYVKPGEKFRLRYGVFVHATPQGRLPDFGAAYSDYLRVTGE